MDNSGRAALENELGEASSKPERERWRIVGGAAVQSPTTASESRSSLDSGFAGRFELSLAGSFVAVNPALAELCGFHSPAEFIAAMASGRGKFFVDPKPHDEALRNALERQDAVRSEVEIHRRDGSAIWISETLRAVRDSAGKPAGFEGVVQDITWRKLAEEVLHQSEEKWRALVESSGECIVIADREGAVVFANSRAQKANVGLPGCNIFSEFNRTSERDLRAAIERAFATMRAEILDLERPGEGGEAVWYEVRVVPIAHAGGGSRVILIATDISTRRRAEEAIREGQRFIGRVADASPAILYVYDVESEHYVYVNHQFEKILGYTAEAFLAGGKSLVDDLAHPDDAVLLRERKRRLAAAEDDGVVFECLYRMRKADGQWLSMRSRDVVFTRGSDGRPAQIIGMAEDVTERQRARQALEHSREQLRALSARLQEAREEERAAISRRVHDELGQALTALNWEFSWLKDRLGQKGGRAEIGAKLATMTGMVDTMMQTVRKVSAELRPPILDHFGLVAAIEWQAQEFQARYQIICEVAKSAEVTLPDRDVSTAVFRIFQEILTNVARHAGATKVRVQLHKARDRLVLIVNDNGRGITEGQKSQSLGILGMQERAHLFGGTVEIAGAPGKGTTVSVHIPGPASEPAQTPRKESLRPLHRDV